MISLTDEENKCYEKQKVCYICKKAFSTDDDNKKYHKVWDHSHYTEKYRGAAHDICNLRYKTAKELHSISYYFYIRLLFHNQWASKGKFDCLWENTEK